MCSHHAKSACYCSLFVREDLLTHYLCLQSSTPLTTKLWLQTSWGKWSHSSPEPSWLCSSICQEEEEVGLGEGNTCIACPLTASDLTPSVLLCFGVWLFPCMQGLQGKVWWTCTFIYLFIYFSGNQLKHTSSTLVGQGSVHGGSVIWDDRGWTFPNELYVSLFLRRYACLSVNPATCTFGRVTSIFEVPLQ